MKDHGRSIGSGTPIPTGRLEWIAMGGMDVRFLGSGDTFGSGGKLHTCIHVRSEETSFLIEGGASSLIAMKRFGVDPSSIDAVMIIHLHGTCTATTSGGYPSSSSTHSSTPAGRDR